jgi:cation:H+ antiporter
LLLVLVGLGLLYFGAEWLVRGSAGLALRLGLTPLVVGLTVVAYGTSTPELVVSVKAAWLGSGDIAVGGVVGSNICNLGAILGLACLIQPLQVKLQLLRQDVPLMAGITALVIGLLWDEHLSRLEGLLLVLGIVAYTVHHLRAARREAAADAAEEYHTLDQHRRTGLGRQVALILGGLLLLFLGGQSLLAGAVQLARGLGVSEAVIGLTVVALGTSFPELAATVVAACRKEGDIALGNIIGSNLFNLLNILGTAALVQPLDCPGISRLDFAMMLALAVLLLPLMRSGFRLQRWEGGLLLMLYIGYVVWLWPK